MKNSLLCVGLFGILLGAGCSSTPTSTQITAQDTIRPLTLTEVSQIDDLVDSITVTSFQMVPDIEMSSIDKILRTKNSQYIIMAGQNLLHYAGDGKFIKKIGEIGRGPGEYTAICDISINDNDQLFAAENTNKVHVYDIETGKLIRSITPQWSGEPLSPDGIIAQGNDYYLLAANPTNQSDFTQPHNCLYKFDNDKQTAESIERQDYIFTGSLTTQSFENDYLIRPLDGENICYKVSNDKITPLYFIDFQDRAAPLKSIYDKNNEFDLMGYLMSDYYKVIINFHDTPTNITFTACGPNAQTHTYVYSLTSGKGFRYADLNRGGVTEPFVFISSDKEFLYGIYSIYDLSDVQIELLDPISKYLVQKIGPLPSNSNPLMVGLKFNI